MARRFQARRGNGCFTRNTLENTCGLHGNWCAACGGFSPRMGGLAAMRLGGGR